MRYLLLLAMLQFGRSDLICSATVDQQVVIVLDNGCDPTAPTTVFDGLVDFDGDSGETLVETDSGTNTCKFNGDVEPWEGTGTITINMDVTSSPWTTTVSSSTSSTVQVLGGYTLRIVMHGDQGDIVQFWSDGVLPLPINTSIMVDQYPGQLTGMTTTVNVVGDARFGVESLNPNCSAAGGVLTGSLTARVSLPPGPQPLGTGVETVTFDSADVREIRFFGGCWNKEKTVPPFPSVIVWCDGDASSDCSLLIEHSDPTQESPFIIETDCAQGIYVLDQTGPVAQIIVSW